MAPLCFGKSTGTVVSTPLWVTAAPTLKVEATAEHVRRQWAIPGDEDDNEPDEEEEDEMELDEEEGALEGIFNQPPPTPSAVTVVVTTPPAIADTTLPPIGADSTIPSISADTSVPTIDVSTVPSSTSKPRSQGPNMRAQMGIAAGVAVAVILVCTICYYTWRWRKRILAGILQEVVEFESDDIDEKTDRDSDDTPSLPGSSNGSSNSSSSSKNDRVIAGRKIPRKPAPALALSAIGADEPRRLIRCSWLTEADQRRLLVGKTFYLEDGIFQPTRKILPMAPKALPKIFSLSSDSSNADSGDISRFSWMTGTQNIARPSIDSQGPPKFRTVDSWVSIQANRAIKKDDKSRSLDTKVIL